MSAAKQPEASDITANEFDQALQEYPALLETISVAKGGTFSPAPSICNRADPGDSP
jgi:hypothetical protein